MTNSSGDESLLINADRHIADARRSVATQEARVRRMKDLGQDANAPEALLQLMEQTLAEFVRHRKILAEDIARRRRGRFPDLPGRPH
jgi:predicted outer membrane protein